MTNVRGLKTGPLTAVFRRREPLPAPRRRPRVVALDPGSGAVADPALDKRVRLHQAFLGRVIDYLCADAGIRQFVDWGCPVPGIAERARRADPEATVVHVAPEGAAGISASPERAAVLSGEGTGVEGLLRRVHTSGLIDFDEPVGVLMTRTFDADSPPGGLETLHDLMRGGGHLALTSTAPRADVERAFGPFRLLDPGVADLTWWPYPDEDVTAQGCGILAGMGHLPARGGRTGRWR